MAFASARYENVNQAVILVDSRMLERIEQRFLDIVQVAATAVWRKYIYRYGNSAIQRRCPRASG
jgi:hypothetical protein